VVVAGAFEEKDILKRIKSLFKGVAVSKKFSKSKTKEVQKKPEILLRHKQSDQTHIILGFRAFDMFDKRRYALEVLGDILGGGMSSRLFQSVREELGAAYYIKSGSDLFTDHGFFAVSAGLDNSRAEQVIGAILKELRKISSDLVGKEELRKSKNHLTGQLMIGLETSDELAVYYGQQELFKDKIITPKELVKKIEAVTAEGVRNVAQDIMKNKDLNLALIGPLKDKKALERILVL
jgi:predicted Zn-dependent peptidase